MESIIIGKVHFNKTDLTGITLKDAKEKYSSLDERIVKRAHKIANPKGVKKPKKSTEE